MALKTFLVALAAWLVMPVLGVANGLFREAALEPRMSLVAAHLVSVAMLLVLLFAVALAAAPYFRRHATRGGHWAVGALWLVLTVGFETLFGHYVLGTSWPDVFRAYNPMSGDLWVVVPLFMLAAPTLARVALERWGARGARASARSA